MGSTSTLDQRPLPKSFILELTQRCNNACQYCYTAWNAPALGYRQRSSGELPTAACKKIISRLQDEAAPQVIGISGGEPLLREDLPELLAFIRKRGITPYLITNGTLLTAEIARAIKDYKSACEITLLSFRPEIHDALAGRRGARDAAIQGMANLAVAGAQPVMVFVATRLNYMDLYRTAELGITLGAAAISYNRLNLGAYNYPMADRLLPTPSMIRENLDMLEALAEKYGVPVTIGVVIEPCVVDTRPYQHLQFGFCPQAGEGSYFTIDPQGNVRICNHSPTILGNLLHDSFTEIYYNHPYVHQFRQTWPVECQDCDPELKELCGGGCKAAAEQCRGGLEHVDPFVSISLGEETALSIPQSRR